jgi:hypothetical protein
MFTVWAYRRPSPARKVGDLSTPLSPLPEESISTPNQAGPLFCIWIALVMSRLRKLGMHYFAVVQFWSRSNPKRSVRSYPTFGAFCAQAFTANLNKLNEIT